MKLGVLFSGGKDSTYAAWLAKQGGHDLICLISIFSKNKDSFMFHTTAIELTKKQAELMSIPLLIIETEGEKEKEIIDLKLAINKAINLYGIEGIITGALASVYQASRIQKICNELKIKCINPLWGKSQEGLLEELIKENFEIIISAVAAFPLDKSWVGRKIDANYLSNIKELKNRYKINPAGEGGEFESLVVNCPMFRGRLDVQLKEVVGEGNSWRGLFS